MTVKQLAGAPSAGDQSWNAINWQKAQSEVRRLQMRIAKAVQEQCHGKVRALQWMLTHSYSAKVLAIKRVTGNRGAKTAGIDGVVWRTEKQKMLAVSALKRKGCKPQPAALTKNIYPQKE